MEYQLKNRVCVLMSTYNGEKYIDEQIRSIMEQLQVDVSLYIRDDGSSDNTVEKVKSCQKKYGERICFTKGKNVGFANSFMKLVTTSSRYDYYAFSDQDDIWDPNKLIKAIEKINKQGAMLYASNLKAVDESQKSTSFVYNPSKKEQILESMERYIFISNPYGCTMVWNLQLHEFLQHYKKPYDLTHDVWVYIVARCCGDVYFDFDSYIQYRIHANNTCGATPRSLLGRIKKYYKFYFKSKKRLLIKEKCQVIDQYFPEKSSVLIKCLGNYQKNIISFFEASYMVLNMKVGNYSKFKYITLMVFRKF